MNIYNSQVHKHGNVHAHHRLLHWPWINETLIWVVLYQYMYYVHLCMCTCICIYLSKCICILIFLITNMGSDNSIFSCVPAMLSITEVFFFSAHYYLMSKIWMMFILSHFALVRTLLKSTYSKIGTVYNEWMSWKHFTDAWSYS